MTQWREYCCTFQGNSAEGVHNNVGLSLVMLSQLFVPFMNVTIKVLNQIEPPVPTFELVMVSMQRRPRLDLQPCDVFYALQYISLVGRRHCPDIRWAYIHENSKSSVQWRDLF
ncbi:hypothetical protein EDC04DRAFT_1436282 [Pisolithus marmoratus]|nr:hypothetical protein EDC04DRAFT_1436282 [Pisolithus marmoratus]